jgi:hypothetical protein
MPEPTFITVHSNSKTCSGRMGKPEVAHTPLLTAGLQRTKVSRGKPAYHRPEIQRQQDQHGPLLRKKGFLRARHRRFEPQLMTPMTRGSRRRRRFDRVIECHFLWPSPDPEYVFADEEDSRLPTTRSRSRSPLPTPRTPSPKSRRDTRTPTSGMQQSRLEYGGKHRDSTSRVSSAGKTDIKTIAKFDLSPYHAKASQPATFDHLGLTAFGERSITSWSTRMSYKTPQIKFHRKAVTDLQSMLIALTDAECEIHKRLLVGALLSWGANGTKLSKLSSDSLTKLLAACYALSH